jgi:regulator of sigma D
MSESNDNIQERWENVHSLLERLLEERQTLIVQYCKLSGTQTYTPGEEKTLTGIRHFCQVLVDYVSAGHFEVYAKLIDEAEAFKDGSAEIAKTLLPKINISTSAAVEFNDLYESADGPFVNLSRRLSKLGELLESRFQHEDELIGKLHDAHREQIA